MSHRLDPQAKTQPQHREGAKNERERIKKEQDRFEPSFGTWGGEVVVIFPSAARETMRMDEWAWKKDASHACGLGVFRVKASNFDQPKKKKGKSE